MGDKFLSVHTPLAPPGRGVGGEGVLARLRVALCNQSFATRSETFELNACITRFCECKPSPPPVDLKVDPKGRGALKAPARKLLIMKPI